MPPTTEDYKISAVQYYKFIRVCKVHTSIDTHIQLAPDPICFEQQIRHFWLPVK